MIKIPSFTTQHLNSNFDKANGAGPKTAAEPVPAPKLSAMNMIARSIGDGLYKALLVNKSIAAGILASNVLYATFMTFHEHSSARYTDDYIPLIVMGSLYGGLIRGVLKHKSLLSEATLPKGENQGGLAPKKDPGILAKTAASIGASWNTYESGFVIGTVMAAFREIVSPRSYHNRHPDPFPAILCGSALFGAISGIRKYRSMTVDDGSPTLAQRWNKLSRTKKVCAVALGALGTTGAVMCATLGPRGAAYQAYHAAAAAGETIQPYIQQAKYMPIYSIKTQTLETEREWINSYTPEQEIERIATAFDNKSPCAKILFTCDIPEDDITTHKKVFRDKQKTIHPDQYSGALKDLAYKASQGLNDASSTIRSTGRCPGYDLVNDVPSCEGIDDPLDFTITRTLWEPRWLYSKLTGAKSECLWTNDDGTVESKPLEDCATL